MTIHKEGYPTLLITSVVVVALNLLTGYVAENLLWVQYGVWIFSIGLLLIVLQFFRHPNRVIRLDENIVLAPADGKVVVIEETQEDEYIKGRCIQVSIFMSPFNVHVNRYPISGILRYVKYHPGKYLVAWHPKSSTENERTSIAIENAKGQQLLLRQIAGALARRIVWYGKQGQQVKQGSELGFIKFGSRVDIFLPLGTEVAVKLQEKVIGGETIIAKLT